MDILIGTFTMRPYVFAFFAAFLLACVPHVGWRRTLTFTVVGYLIAFASEWLSINTGFPYGWYYYIDSTSNRELWVAGVPFFDSLSYVFLAYCSYATALFILSPLRPGAGTWRPWRPAASAFAVGPGPGGIPADLPGHRHRPGGPAGAPLVPGPDLRLPRAGHPFRRTAFQLLGMAVDQPFPGGGLPADRCAPAARTRPKGVCDLAFPRHCWGRCFTCRC